MSSTTTSTRYSSLHLKDIVCLCATGSDEKAWWEFVSRVVDRPRGSARAGGQADVTLRSKCMPNHTDTASCPNDGAIPCLLLQSIGNQKGPTGGNLLAKATFVQRLNTRGGAALTTACTIGQTQLVPYTADYFFYRSEKQ